MDLVVPAWNSAKEYLGLRAVLNAVGANDWIWRLEEFSGMSTSDSGLNVLELEDRLETGTYLTLTWDGLTDFADKVHQMVDGLLVAFDGDGDARPVLAIEARDSGDWKIVAEDGNPSAVAAARRIAAARP
jgi:hypothetical protein